MIWAICKYCSKSEDNIKTERQDKGYESVEWIELAQYRNQWWDFVNTVMHLRVSQQ
jgi:hypothetical protein